MKDIEISPNAKSDYSVAGETVIALRKLLNENISIAERIELTKLLISILDKRLNIDRLEILRAQVQAQLDGYNKHAGTSIKIRNLELKKFDEITD